MKRRQFIASLGVGVAALSLLGTKEEPKAQPILELEATPPGFVLMMVDGKPYWIDMVAFAAEQEWRKAREMELFGRFAYNAGTKQRLGIE